MVSENKERKNMARPIYGGGKMSEKSKVLREIKI